MGLPVAIPEKYHACLLDYFYEEHYRICHMNSLGGVISGGRDWMPLLLRGFSYVMFVLPWVSTLQGHQYLPFEMAC